MRLPKAHQVVLGIGVAMFVFVIASGVMPAITHWHDNSPIQREVFVNVPTAMKVAFYAAVATMLLIVAWLASLRVQQLRARPARRPAHDPQERREARQELPQRRVDADAAARPRRRRHALVPLLRVRLAVHRDRDQRDRPPDARPLQVPARPDVPGVLGRRRGRGDHVPGRHRLGDRPALRAAPVPHPHQDQARGRDHPRHVPRHRAHRLLRRSGAHRVRGQARASRSGRSSATRSRTSIDTWSLHTLDASCTGGCGACTSWRSSRSSRSCRPRSCATCSRRR